MRSIIKALRGSIRTKVLLVLFLILLFPIFFSIAQDKILLDAIKPVEDEVLQKHRLRFERLIQLQSEEMLASSLGWSIWTEMWEFVDNPRDSDWIMWRIENIDDFVPKYQKIDLVVIARKDGEVVFEIGDHPDFRLGTSIISSDVFRLLSDQKKISGFVKTTTGYYYIAASSIHHTSDNNQVGPTNGVYIIGRQVDEAYLDKFFASKLIAPVALRIDDKIIRSNPEALVADSNTTGETIRFSSSEIALSFPLDSVIDDSDLPIVTISESRDIFMIARNRLVSETAILGFFFLLSLVFVFIYFGRVVIRPLFRFLREVELTRTEGKLSNIPVMKTGDEFERLSETYNKMVEMVGVAEEQLISSQNFLRAILDTIPIPVSVVDLDSERLTTVNPAARDFFSRVVGSEKWTDYKLFMRKLLRRDGSRYPILKLPFTITKKTNATSSVDDVMVRVDGKLAHLIITARPVSLPKSRPQILIAIEDISKQREIEQAKSEFLDIVTHQLRTPLTALRWTVEAIETAKGNERKQYMREISASVQHMLELVNALLDIARIDSGRIKLSVRTLKVHNELKDVLVELRPKFAEKNIEQDFSAPQGISVYADPRGFHEVFSELINNALKYTPKKGKISVRARQDKGMVSISVTDTGLGVPEKDIPHIFEKFFRASNASEVEGTGLGLAMAKVFVEAMGGSISLKSTPGKGTTVTVKLKQETKGAVD